MTDSVFQEKFNQAWNFKKDGKVEAAMNLYAELYQQLIRDAFDHTGGSTGTEEEDELKVNEYLRGDKLSCTILNNMGVILAETGNREAAKNYFEDSIKLTPKGLDYQDPIIRLKELQ